MSEYIERDAAISAAIDAVDEWDGDPSRERWAKINAAMESIPAADVRPVVRGRWIQTTQPMGWHDEECATCSVCGEDFVLGEWSMDEFKNLMHYCPNCGAKMEES